MSGIVGIVLGAGASQRLGRPKQTLPFGARSLLGHVVDQAERSSLERVVVVIGGADDAAGAEVRAALPAGRAEVVRNVDSGLGCASSLQAGLGMTGGADAVVMVLGDMPGVTADVIDRVADHWRGRPTWAAVASYDDGLGHPLLFSADAFDELRALRGDKAVWKIIDREPPERVARVVFHEPCPLDVDTWEDYLAVCAAFAVEPEGAPGHPRGP